MNCKSPHCECDDEARKACDARLTKRYPDGNPKTLLGEAKVPLGLVSPVAMAHEAKAMALGERKYGPANWREAAVSSSVYFNAALRHIYLWWEGQDIDPESSAHHLGHARACLGIVLDAASVGKLNDNRPSKGGLEEVLEALRVKPESEKPKVQTYAYRGSSEKWKGTEGWTLLKHLNGTFMQRHHATGFTRIRVKPSGSALFRIDHSFYTGWFRPL